MNSLGQHKLLLVIAAVIVAAIAWYVLSSGSSAPTTSNPDLVTTTAAGTSADATNPADQSLVSTLLQLRAVTLSGTIFSDPAFLALQDFSTPIVQEPVGRQDPFAPLQQSAVASASSTKSAQIFKAR